ncbi:MAG: hypothetical protein PHG91_00580 [Syntrophales bacterium]|nr:hypothetical protein [Syntrophales bacterium]MDD5231865.1 hypothetical protein [Syntrophales bacterium]MDD5531550.1 hypothetical protein [Syntrophales bacterium]
MKTNGQSISDMLLKGMSMKLCFRMGESQEWLPIHGVFVKDRSFWAHSMHHLLEYSDGVPLRITTVLADTGETRFASSIRENLGSHKIDQLIISLPARSVDLILVDDYEEIYQSGEGDAEAVRKAIAVNADLKCAFLDKDGFWHICRTHIPYAQSDSGKIYFQTAPFKFQPVFLTEEWRKQAAGQMESIRTNHQGIAVINTAVSHAQYMVDLDGRYTDMTSQMNKSWRDSVAIRIFRQKTRRDISRAIY